MLRVCSTRGITAISILWRKKSEESRQVAIFSELGALRAIIGLDTTSALHRIVMFAARIKHGDTYPLQSTSFPSPRDLVMCNSIWQPGGAK